MKVANRINTKIKTNCLKNISPRPPIVCQLNGDRDFGNGTGQICDRPPKLQLERRVQQPAPEVEVAIETLNPF
ncbi:MAG: hypothetical protein ACK58Z_22065, partial [Pseudanabaena sp.]